MRVSLGSKIQKSVSDVSVCQKQFGKRMAGVIFRRLNQLSASSTLETMRNLGRCHELKDDWSGNFAVDLVHPYRLIFKPDNDNKDYLDGRTIVWKRVVAVEIVDIVDYH